MQIFFTVSNDDDEDVFEANEVNQIWVTEKGLDLMRREMPVELRDTLGSS